MQIPGLCPKPMESGALVRGAGIFISPKIEMLKFAKFYGTEKVTQVPKK